MSAEVKWRRKFKHSLLTNSWKSLVLPDSTENLFIKYVFTTKSYNIMVTNLKESFIEVLDSSDCHKRNKKLNPNVEAPLDVLLGHLQERLSDQQDSIDIKWKDTGIVLKLNSKIGGLPFLWEFKLEPCEANQAAEHISMPLSAMVGELLRQQTELIKVISNKDKEIEDYKNQGAKVTRRHLQTSRFDETSFLNDMYTSKGFESRAKDMCKFTFTSQGQELYTNLMCKQAFITRNTEEDDNVSSESDVALSPNKTKAVGNSWGNRVPGSLIPSQSNNSSPSKSPAKSPAHVATDSGDNSPKKDSELLRRQALERKLAEEEGKQEEKTKKKKKKLKL